MDARPVSTVAVLLFSAELRYLGIAMRKLTHAEIAARRTPAEGIHQAVRVPLIVVVDNVRSLYNVGSLFRTADGVMLERLVLTGYSPHPPRKEIEKTALGATATVPWEYIRHPADAVRRFKAEGYRAFSLELTDHSAPLHTASPRDFPMCLVVGNEIVGVSADAIAECEGALEIPMFGMKQSLNVAVAFGIAVFELGRIWRAAQSNARV
jgi:tRNA G18 (ribose-2'-O)-methylase SpoU